MEAVKNKKLLVLKVTIITILLLAGMVTDILLKFEIEKVARQQARYNLEQAKYCVNKIVDNVNNEINTSIVSEALQVCSQKMRTSQTGDMFAFRLDTDKFVFDPSIDCQVDGGKKADDNNLCELFSNNNSCKRALVYLKSGYDSSTQRVSWRFLKDSDEWLEWKVLPSEDRGFYGLERTGVIKPFQVVLAQGVVAKEIYDMFKPYTYTLHGLMFLVMFIILVTFYIMEKKAKNEK